MPQDLGVSRNKIKEILKNAIFRFISIEKAVKVWPVNYSIFH